MGIPIEFCELFIQKSRQKITLFDGVEARRARGTWIPANQKNFGVVVKQYASHAEICLQETTKTESNRKFDLTAKFQSEIEKKYGGKLRWQRLPENKRSKIMTYPLALGYEDNRQWPFLIEQLTDDAMNFFNAIAKYVPKK